MAPLAAVIRSALGPLRPPSAEDQPDSWTSSASESTRSWRRSAAAPWARSTRPTIPSSTASSRSRRSPPSPAWGTRTHQRFQREAQAAAVLSHMNIVTVHDFGEEQGLLYIAMELLEGTDLREAIDRELLKSIDDKLSVMEQICCRPLLRPLQGRHPPRPQAREHPHPAQRPGEDRGLRTRADRHVRDDAGGHRPRHPQLHVPRAGDGRPRGRALRHLLRGRRLLRDPLQPQALRRGLHSRSAVPGGAQGPRGHPAVDARSPPRPRGRGGEGTRQGQDPPLPDGAADEGRAVRGPHRARGRSRPRRLARRGVAEGQSRRGQPRRVPRVPLQPHGLRLAPGLRGRDHRSRHEPGAEDARRLEVGRPHVVGRRTRYRSPEPAFRTHPAGSPPTILAGRGDRPGGPPPSRARRRGVHVPAAQARDGPRRPRRDLHVARGLLLRGERPHGGPRRDAAAAGDAGPRGQELRRGRGPGRARAQDRSRRAPPRGRSWSRPGSGSTTWTPR